MYSLNKYIKKEKINIVIEIRVFKTLRLMPLLMFIKEKEKINHGTHNNYSRR